MTEHLNFDGDDTAAGEPAAVFTFAGRDWTVKSAEQIPFRTLERIVGLHPQDMVSVEDLFRQLLVPEDVEEFVQVLRSDDNPVSLGKIRNIIRGVAEAVAQVPTTPSVTSPAG